MSLPLQKLMGRLYREELSDDGGSGDSAGTNDGKESVDNKKADDKKADDKNADDATKKKISDEEARLLKENMKKKEQLDKISKELADAKNTLKQIEELGDIDGLKALVKERSDAEKKHLEQKGSWDLLQARMADEHKREMDALQAKLQAAEDELATTKGHVKELSIGSLFGQSRFISDELTLTPAKARVIYSDHFDLVDGKVVGYDKPRGSAGRTAIVDQYGSPMNFEDSLRKIIDADPEKDHLLKSKAHVGAGSDSKKGEGKKVESAPTSGMDKIAAGIKKLNLLTTPS